MSIQVSPGLVQREIDLSLYLPALSTTNLALAGVARKGDFNTIHEVGSLAEYVEKLGIPTTQMGYVAQEYLRQGKLLKVVRVGDGNEAASSGYLPGRSTTVTEQKTDDDVGTYEAVLSAAPKPGTLYIGNINSVDGSIVDAVAWETDTVSGTLVIKDGGSIVGSGTINYTTKALTLTLTGKNVAGTSTDRPDISYVYGASTGNGMQFLAKSEGTWGDNLKVKLLSIKRKSSDGTPLSASLGVYENDALVETIQISKGSGNAPTFAIGQDDIIGAFEADEDLSDYIDAAEPSGGHIALIPGDICTLSGGADGDTYLSTSNLIGVAGSSPTGLQLFSNAEAVNINLIAAPYFAVFGPSNYLMEDEKIGEGDGTITPSLSGLARYPLANDASATFITLSWTSSSVLNSVTADASGDFSGNSEIDAGAVNESTGAWQTSLSFDSSYIPDAGTDITVSYYWSGAAAAAWTVAQALITLCESRGDCMALVDPPYGLDTDEIIDWHNGEGDFSSLSALDSSYAALYWPWHTVYDSYEGQTVSVAPSGPASAIMAYTDYISEVWFAPAGLQRGKCPNSLSIELSPDLAKRERLLSASPANAVNPFVKFSGEGIVLWGQKTLQRTPTVLDRVNVRRLLLYMEKLLATVAQFFIFEPNDEKTWRRFVAMAEEICDPVKSRRGLYDFRVICDSSTNTPAVIDQNKMAGKILLKPTKTAEVILVDWTLLSTGMQFTELI